MANLVKARRSPCVEIDSNSATLAFQNSQPSRAAATVTQAG
jgi:hypothetical protein